MRASVIPASASRRWVAALFAGLALAPPLWAQSRPAILEASTKLLPPDPAYMFIWPALSGDNLLIMGLRRDNLYTHALFAYERQSDGTWSYTGQIASGDLIESGLGHLALEGDTAVFGIDFYDVRILEKVGCCWLTTEPDLSGQYARDVKLRDGTVAVGVSRYPNAYVDLLRKDATGRWVVTAELKGAQASESSNFAGPTVGFTGTMASAASSYEGIAETHVFDLINGSWQKTAQLNEEYEAIALGNELAFRDEESLSPGEVVGLIRRNSAGSWSLRTRLLAERHLRPGSVFVEDGLAYVGAFRDDLRGRDSGSLAIFEPVGTDFIHRATLVARDGSPDAGFGSGTADGRRIAVTGGTTDPSTGEDTTAVYLFELPASFDAATRVQHDFQDMNAAGWTPWGTPDWRVRAIDGSYAYRQLSVQGDARAILDEPVLENQGIEADVTVRSLGTTSWVGLMARYVDPRNFYYLLVNNSSVQIRRMLNGAFGPLATASFALRPNVTHRVRLEAVGSRIRAFVDGNLVVETIDDTIPQGKAGLTMWKTAADFDNVVVSTSPSTELFGRDTPTPWTLSPASAWVINSEGPPVLRQSSASIGDARAINGAPAEDQVITAEIRPRAFHASGTGWAGLIARYVDDRNYYYVVLGDNDKISVRKLSNGAITVLEEVPFTVTQGTTYRVRFEAVGDALRLYVNGRLRAEGKDEQFATGRYGAMTYRAAADFSSFVVTRP